MGKVHLISENEVYDFDEIKEQIPFSNNEILTFCHHWLNDQQYFSINTSGSTGNPKTIEIGRQRMIKSAQMTSIALNLKPKSNYLLCLNPNFIGGMMMLVRAMENDCNIYCLNPTSNPLEQIPAIEFEFAAMVPIQLHNSINQQPEKLNQFNKIIIGGAPIQWQTEKACERLKPKIYQTYGMTETVSHIALKRLNHQPQKYYSILPHIEINKDKRNCLTIKGDITNNETLITNDIVELIDEMHFKWIGRLDFVINSGGVKIHPETVEKAIERLFDDMGMNNRFFISSVKDDYLGQKVVLILEGHLPNIIKNNKLDKLLTGQLNKYEIPKHIFELPHFIETENAKINKKATLAKYGIE